MAACIYVRTTTASKSIPKLEQQAAVIGSRLCKFVLDELRFKPNSVLYWADSTTVLAWLKNMSRRKDFCSNRVTEILSTSKESQWNHISGNRNPADHATRGIPLSDVDKLWFQPPDFLMKPESEWFKPPHRA